MPHRGWNTRRATADAEPLLEGIDDGSAAYFVHGYAAPVSFDSAAIAVHGKPFCAVVRSGLYCGAQFHPERSAATGARLLANFLRSEEHTSELQSLMRISYAVFCLKKKKTTKNKHYSNNYIKNR